MEPIHSSRSGPLAVGIIGCGYWGPNYVRNFDRLPDVEVGAVCDLCEERLRHIRTRYPEVNCFRSCEEMLAGPPLDAVVVATPARSHHALAKAALEAGKHTLIEKPMALSVAQCEELARIARERGLTLMVGHTYLYSEPVRRIMEIIASGDLGEVRYVNSQRLNLGVFQTDINAAWDLAPHDLSIILPIFGEMPESINCQGNAHITPGVEDVVNISMKFGGNRFATIQNSWLEPRKVRQMTIVGTKWMIVFDDLEPLEKLRIYDVRVEALPHYDTFSEFHYAYHYGDSFVPHLRQVEPLKELCTHFLECLRTGARPRSCGRQGTRMVSILEAASASLAVGGASVALNGGGSGGMAFDGAAVAAAPE